MKQYLFVLLFLIGLSAACTSQKVVKQSSLADKKSLRFGLYRQLQSNCSGEQKSFFYSLDFFGGSDIRLFPHVSLNDLENINEKYVMYNDTVYFRYVRDIGSAMAVIVETYYKIEDSDPDSFQPLSHYYSKDKKQAYFYGKRIEGADPATFKVIDSNYSCDKYHVFYHICPLEGADAESFTISTKYYNEAGYDKNYLYYYYNRVEIDYATFTQTGQYTYEDKYRKYTLVPGYLSGEIKVNSNKK